MKNRLSWPGIAALALALGWSATDALAGAPAARTRPAHAGRPAAARPATAAQGRATYGHHPYHRGHRHRGHWYWGASVWYPWLGVAYWPAWGAWYQPYPVVQVPADATPRPALVEVDVKPGKAELRVDGDLAGEARDFSGRYELLALKPGRHVLEFSRPGYLTLRREIRAEANTYLRLTDELERGAGLDPRSDPPASARDEEDDPHAAAPAPTAGDQGLARGLLRIRVTPADAAVYLDGEYLASGGELARLHGALPVAMGRHRIEAVRPGFRGQLQVIDVPEGEPLALEIELERE
jgi:hypothetical protein